MSSANNRRYGFTLIEILITVAIMTLLLAIVGIGISNSHKLSRDAQRISDIHTIATALETYAADHQGIYPVTYDIGNGNKTYHAHPDYISDYKKYFSNGQIPVDPLPINKTSEFEDGGYVYYTQYADTNGQSPATAQRVMYSLTLGLENPKSNDETSLSDKYHISADYKDSPISDSINNNTKRNFYVFNGPGCSATYNAKGADDNNFKYCYR